MKLVITDLVTVCMQLQYLTSHGLRLLSNSEIRKDEMENIR